MGTAVTRLSLLLLAALVLLAGSADTLWSLSVDLAHHYALVVRLTEAWVLQGANDPSLGEMNVYPRLAHQFAAVLARFVGSPLLGMHLSALLAIFVIWASLGHLLLSLPRQAAVRSAVTLAALLTLNHVTLRLDLHAAEVVNNYFFAQLLAQAFVLGMVALALQLESAAVAPWQRHALLGLAVYVAASIHLLPALMLLAVFLGLVGFELLRLARQRPRPWRPMAVQGLVALLTCLALVRHPTLAVMRDISGNNGQAVARLMPGMNQFLLYALLLLASSGALLLHWWRAGGRAGQGGSAGLALKYLALYGMAVAGLCLLQVLALKLGHGSEYAVQKYLFALNTLLVLQLALWPVWRRSLLQLSTTAAAPNMLLWPLLTIVAWYGVVPANASLDTSDLLRLEQQVMARQDLLMPSEAGKYNHVQAVGQFPPVIDYMLTIGLLHTPRAVTRFSQADSEPLNWRLVGSLVTSADSALDRHPACRRAPPSGGLAVLDGACLGRALGLRQIIGFTSLHSAHACVATGLSVAELFGTWTAAPTVSLRCPMPPPHEMRPRSLEIEATAFLNRVPAQAVRIGVRGQPPNNYIFDSNKPTQRMALELPESLGPEVEVELYLPNATSPSQLGLGPDGRVLGLLLRTLEFK